MACPSFDDLLSGRAGDHAAHCEKCRVLLDALAEVDATLEAAFEGVSAPPGVADGARARIVREVPLRAPSVLPEVLDFIGWAAVLALAAVLLPRFIPMVAALLAQVGV